MADSHSTMALLILLFATAHSGLAALRAKLEPHVGARLYRVIFALVSISLALPLFIYYFNHRYDGLRLWNIQNVTGVHELVTVLSAVAFLFLYPATFNLGEITAIQKPQVHLFETGIIRVTRHPQLVGMTLWCIAHTLWIGTSFALVTALCLVAYHLFAVWHGDHRLYSRYGQAFVELKQHTSVFPFLAIWQGRQQLVLTEFLRPAYLGVIAVVIIFYYLHPLVLTASARLPF
jgi:uncharacterized membrane protein